MTSLSLARWRAFGLAAGLLGSALHAAAQDTAPPTTPPTATPTPAPARAASAPAPAASSAQRVEITGERNADTAVRRQSTAAKIVIGREEIEKFGDATVGEVLRRLPGVTTPGAPGRGGAPRLRGLGGGYTQLLIDGQRIPPGFSLESLTPEQVERIEILRAPTAETGARAIAGTINIITREGFKRRLNDLRFGFGYENGQFTPGLFWTHNDSAGPLTYNLTASVFSNRRDSSSATETLSEGLVIGDPSPRTERSELSTSHERRIGLNLTARLQWRLNEAGDLFMLMPTLFSNESSSTRRFELMQTGGIQPYDSGQGESVGRFTNLRVNTQWRQRLGTGSRLELNGGIGAWRAANDSLRAEFFAGQSSPVRTIEDRSRSHENSLNFSVKLSGALGGKADGAGEHSLVTGAEIDRQRRRETSTRVQTPPTPTALGSDDGDNLEASTTRVAAYVQDEWALNPNWSLHAGLRWEGIGTRGHADNGRRPENRSSVWTPLVHMLWKPDPKKRDQLRLSLTRSYRAPSLASLIARPRYSADALTGANAPTRPDRVGNADLRPEMATGIDLAFERYLEAGGLLSANVFYRRISDLMRNQLSLENVAWSPAQRWVDRPMNIGDATTQGIELEAKFRLDQAFDDAPRIEMRGNLSLFQSRVEGVPGPDNRLDSQAQATANIGADYRFRGVPLTLGGNLNRVPGYRTQLSDEKSTTVSGKRVFDAYALWAFNPAVALRVLASNAAPQDYLTSNTVVTGTLREISQTAAPTYTNWQLRLELKL